jgi:hypothetical protein
MDNTMVAWNDEKFNQMEKSVLWFLFNRENHNLDREDTDVISEAINVDAALCALTVAKLMNDGYIARIIDAECRERYVLSLEGFEYMSLLSLGNKDAASNSRR